MLFEDGSLPWHRLHAVSPEGPVGKNGTVQPGDHLVEVITGTIIDYNYLIVMCSVHINHCRVSIIASPLCVQRAPLEFFLCMDLVPIKYNTIQYFIQEIKIHFEMEIARLSLYVRIAMNNYV